MSERSKRARVLCAVGSFASAIVIVGGVFGGLPARWAPVDVSAVILGVASAASGGLMLANVRFADRVARAVNMALLAVAVVLVVVLAASAAYISDIYGPVGKGGAALLLFVAALVVPYGIALPGAQLLYLGPPPKSKSAETK